MWGGQGVRVRPSGLQLWAWACSPSGPLPSLPSALRDGEQALQAALWRVPGQWAASQVSPRTAFGKRLEGGCGWEEAGSFFLSFSAVGATSGSSCLCLLTPAPRTPPTARCGLVFFL